jgi:hypothetical protein
MGMGWLTRPYHLCKIFHSIVVFQKKCQGQADSVHPALFGEPGIASIMSGKPITGRIDHSIALQ